MRTDEFKVGDVIVCGESFTGVVLANGPGHSAIYRSLTVLYVFRTGAVEVKTFDHERDARLWECGQGTIHPEDEIVIYRGSNVVQPREFRRHFEFEFNRR